MDPKGKVALVTGGASGIGFAFCKEFLKEGGKLYQGKVALVTGGASGIGFAFCKELLTAAGKGIAICDIDASMGHRKVIDLEEEFGKECAVFIKTDVTKQNEFEEAFKKTISVFKNIDIVLNNAGIFDDRAWDRQVDINVKGVIRGLLLAYQYLGKDKGGNGGTVINVSSLAGISPGLGIPIYSGLKSAVVGLTNAFGNEFYKKNTDIRVMAMCPGMTNTHIIPPHDCLLNSEWDPIVREYANPEIMQSVENVSRGLLYIIREGSHGSIWVSVDDKPPEEVKIPYWEALRVNKSN